MAKKRRSRQRAQGAPTKLRHLTVMQYPVYAYKPGEPDPEPAHIRCAMCCEVSYLEAVPFGPLLACDVCGAGLSHGDFVAAEKPLLFLTREEKQAWLDQRFVSSHMRGSVLRLKLLLPPRPQPSMTTTGISEGVADGKAYALAVLAAYTPCDREGTIPQWDRYGEEAA
jgi:hypothetical protein